MVSVQQSASNSQILTKRIVSSFERLESLWLRIKLASKKRLVFAVERIRSNNHVLKYAYFGLSTIKAGEVHFDHTLNLTDSTPFLGYLLHLEENGKTLKHLKFVTWKLARLSKNADLNNPKEVDKYIRTLPVKNSYKQRLVTEYKNYCDFKEIYYAKPKFSDDSKELRIPTHERIEMIIAESGKTLALKLTVSLETGLRPVELLSLKVKDVDLTQNIIYPITAKHGAPRKLKISNSLSARIQEYIIKRRLQQDEQLFKGTSHRYGNEFREVRNRLAKKLNDESIKTVRLYDLRHYFATTEYIKTKDLKHVQYLMGHKFSNTTDKYTHVLDCNAEEEYTVKVAKTLQEATDLIEHGFQYITEMEGLKIFKKRK